MGTRVSKFVFVFLIIISSALFAGDFSVGGAFEYRDSNTTINSNTFLTHFRYNDTSLSFQMQSGEYSSSLIYQPRIGKSISFRLIAHTLYVPEEGGFSDFSLVFKQHFQWHYFALRYSLGAQLGVAYSEYASFLSFSVSPLVGVGFDLIFNPVKISFDYGLDDDFERSWKAVPIARASLSLTINEKHELVVSSFVREAEYLMDPWHLITAWGVSFGYVYRGNV